MKLWTVLMIVAVVASAMAVLFVLHTEADASSAEVVDNGQCGPSAQYAYYSDGTLVISGSGSMYDYNSNAAPWADYRENITKVVIEDKITHIGQSAFKDCSNIEELVMPITLNSVTSDSNPAFANCCNIKKVEFTCGTNGYGCDYAAYPVSNSWYQNTPWFQSRGVLTDIVFDDGIKCIGADAFRELYITSLVLPNSVCELRSHSFFDCKSLTELTLPISLNAVWLDKYPAFDGVNGLTKVIFTPGSGYGYNYGAYEDINCWYKHTPWFQSRDVLTDIVFEEGITHIGSDAFRELYIAHVEIPNSVTALDNHTFFDCEKLTYLSIPITLNSIYNAKYPAFEKCLALADLKLTAGTDGVGVNYVTNGGNNCYQTTPWFVCRDTLKEVVFEEGVKTIGSHAFRELNITSLVIPDSVTALSEYSFFDCEKLTDLTIPVTLNSVASDIHPAFYQCTNIAEVTLTTGTDGVGFNYAANAESNAWYQNTPWHFSRTALKGIAFAYGVKTVGDYTFDNSSSFNGSVTMPDTVTAIGKYAFSGCVGIKSVDLGKVTSIDKSAFSGCTALTVLVIPETVVSLGESAFSGCTGLKALTIPVSLNAVASNGNPAFKDCAGIEKIVFTVGTGNGYTYGIDSSSSYSNFFRYTPWFLSGSVLKEIVLTDGIRNIGNYMFDSCVLLTSVNLPASLMEIGEYAFNGCTGLTSVNLGLVAKIGEHAFCGCTALASVDLANISWIGDSAFSDCTSLTTLVIPDTIMSLGTAAFSGCTGLKTITLPINLNAVVSNGNPAFKDCTNVEKVIFTVGSGEGIVYGTSSASSGTDFYGYTPWYLSRSVLKAVVFEDGIKTIGSNAFRELNITSLVIPNSVTSLGEHTFYQCTKLTKLTIPITLDSVYSAANPAFGECLGIKVLRMTAGTDGVGFDYTDCVPIWCTPLHRADQIIFDSGITYLGAHAFDGYSFFGTEGDYIQPVAHNLSGHAFAGVDGLMYLTENISGKYVDGKYVNNILIDDGIFVRDSKFVDGRFAEIDSDCNEIPTTSLDSIVAPVSAGVLC